MAHDSDVFLFLKKFTEDDLSKVARHIRNRYEDKPEIMNSMLRFSYLIRQLDTFGELLAEAEAMRQRYRKLTERESVLGAVGREEKAPERPVTTPKEVMSRMTPEQLAQGWAAVRAALEKPPEDDRQDEPMMPYQPILEPPKEAEPGQENNYGVEIEEEKPKHE